MIEGIEVGWGRVVTPWCSYPMRGLVEIELSLGRSAGWGEAWGPVVEAEVAEEALDDDGLGEEGEDAQSAVAAGAAQGVEFVDPSEELGPADAGGGGG